MDYVTPYAGGKPMSLEANPAGATGWVRCIPALGWLR
jgi:hypothetical protein